MNSRIATLVHKDGKAGSKLSWRSTHYTDSAGNQRRQIHHYGTLMLEYTEVPTGSQTWPFTWDGSTTTVYYDTGHGSVSDQGGMNQFFRKLDMPWRYSRAGGASIS